MTLPLLVVSWLMQPGIPLAFSAMAGLFTQLVVQGHPGFPFHRAAPQTSRCQPMLVLSQAHYLALVLVEPPKVLVTLPACSKCLCRTAVSYGVSTIPLSLESLANFITVHLMTYFRSLIEDTKQSWVQRLSLFL